MKLKLFLSLFLVSQLSWSLTLAVEDSWPPFSDKNGNGYSKQIILAAFKTVGLTPKFKVAPYSRALSMAKTGDADGCFNVTKQHTTSQTYIFGKTPILKASASFYVRAGEFSQFSKIDAIPKDFKIGVINEYEYGDEYEKHRHRLDEIKVKNQAQLIQMLLRKRIDGVILFDEVAKYTLKKMNLKKSLIEPRFTNHTSEIFVAFSKLNPRATEFARKLDMGLEKIIKDGTYLAIFSRKNDYID